MKTHSFTLLDHSLAGVLARLTHGILHDAGKRTLHQASASAGPRPTRSHAQTDDAATSWLDRLDTWFWKLEMKHRDAFLARSLDIFDLERRVRCLERGDKWLGTDRV